jgi:hypothetical protein
MLVVSEVVECVWLEVYWEWLRSAFRKISGKINVLGEA